MERPFSTRRVRGVLFRDFGMKKNLILGFLIGAVLLYFSLRGIDFGGVADGFRTLKYIYLVPVVVLLVLLQVLRSYRLGVILSPIEKIDQLTLFAITSVGFMALAAIPARVGELARPYLIKRKTGMKMTVALGSIFIERIFDSLTVLIVFFIVLFFVPLPSWLVKSSIIFLAITLAILIGMLVLIFKRDASLAFIERIFPNRLQKRVSEVIHHFVDGIEVITDFKLLSSVTILSMTIWFLDAAAIYILFLAFGMNLSITAAFIVMVVLIIGITLPTAPGYIGNWHFFCIAGLSLFGIPKADALTYAIILHFVSVGIVVVLGLIFLPFNRFSFSDLTTKQNQDI